MSLHANYTKSPEALIILAVVKRKVTPQSLPHTKNNNILIKHYFKISHHHKPKEDRQIYSRKHEFLLIATQYLTHHKSLNN